MRRASRSAVAQALQSSGIMAPRSAQLQCILSVDSAQAFDRERAAMKCFPFVAVSLCVASLTACSFKEERVVQPAPAVVTSVPPAP